MDFGMPTLIELPGIEDCAKLCSELGLKFIEVNMNLPQYQPDKIDVDEFLSIAKKYGIYYTIHADENFDACNYNSFVAKAYFETLVATIKLAKAIKCPVINMHLHDGVRFSLPDKKIYLFEMYEDIYLSSQKKFVRICEEELLNNKIKICIENASGFRSYHIHALDILINSNVFGLTLDIGHSYCNGGEDEKTILSFKDKLCHLHIHDAYKTEHTKKDHLILGCGEIDLHKYFDLANKTNSRVVLETKTVEGLKTSVDWIIERGLK